MSSYPDPSNNPDLMAQALESALLAALSPIVVQLDELNQKISDLQSENSALKHQLEENQNSRLNPEALPLNQINQRLTQLEDQQSSHQTEMQRSLTNLLSSLTTFNERMSNAESSVSEIEKDLSNQVSQTSQIVTTQQQIERKLPTLLNAPFQVFLEGETLTLRKLGVLLLIMISLFVTVEWSLQQILPGIQRQTYLRLNNLEIQMKRIEKRLR